MSLKRQIVLKERKFKKSRWWIRFKRLIVFAIVATTLVFLWHQVRPWLYSQGWTGFGSTTTPKDEREKTLWDWMDLLIVPLVLGLGLYGLNHEERKSEQQIAADQLQESALQNYFDKMAELTLEREMFIDETARLNTKKQDVASRIARARTLALLPGLNGMRKGMIVRFLWETDLITGKEPIINLFRADLTEIQLQGHSLENVFLSGTALNKANLRIALLNGADLSKADLKNADLTLAYVLPMASYDSNEIEDDPLEFIRYYSREGYIKGKFQVNLRGANLDGANLEGASLYGVNLEDASLHGTKLWHSKLDGANLKNAKVTDKQLKQAASLYAATMCDGTRYDGQFNLSGDLEKAKGQGVNILSPDALRRWYAGQANSD